MTQHVFISYCRENKPEVAQLVAELESEGIKVWWDNLIYVGQDWKVAIRQAIKQSDAFILCLSKESENRLTSGIYPEVLYAIEKYREYKPGSVFILPIRLSECELPSIEIDAARTLDRLHYVDLFPESNRTEGLRKIIESIKILVPPSIEKDLKSSIKKDKIRVLKTEIDNEQHKAYAVPKLGDEVPKCCDRGIQESEFREFLSNNKQLRQEKPQICIIQGNDGEAHESLVKRFRSIIIQPEAEEKYGSEYGTVVYKEIRRLLLDGSLRIRQQFLLDSLFSLFGKVYKEDFKADEALAKILSERKEKVLVLQHNLGFSGYDSITIDLLKFYINLWNEISMKGSKMPEIFIFLNIFFPALTPDRRMPWLLPEKLLHKIVKIRIKRKLQNKLHLKKLSSFNGTLSEIYPCIMLTELSCVRLVHIMDWFRDYNFYSHETYTNRLEIAKNMFREKGKLLKCRRMSDIEKLLKEIVENHKSEIELI